MNKSKLQAWLYAFRLRTLPLAFSSIITGSSVAFMLNRSSFSWLVFGLCLLTTLLLQILSNLANDYGDSEKGTDNEDRIGPKRAVQAGMLSFKEIKAGIMVAVILSLISGSLLIKFALGDALNVSTVGFFLLGLAAIGAAIKYTIGTGAYGYIGLGDVFVLLFFGFVGVGGSYYLQAKNVDWAILLPGFTIGAFASGVLNLNNMRDRISDAKAGKNTLVVKLGAERAKTYHTALIWLAFMAALAFAAIRFKSTMQFSFILTLPLFRKHMVSVKRIENPAEFDPFLKQLAISTFIFSLLFAFGMMISE